MAFLTLEDSWNPFTFSLIYAGLFLHSLLYANSGPMHCLLEKVLALKVMGHNMAVKLYNEMHLPK